MTDTGQHRLYTAGYAGWTPADLLMAQQELHATLVDIRATPYSSALPVWNKSVLADRVREAFGHGWYIHMPALGNVNHRNGGPIQLAAPDRAVKPIRDLLRIRSVILLCACYHAETCHRTDAAAYVADQLLVEVEHLAPRPRARKATA